jgi:O-antigen ligase
VALVGEVLSILLAIALVVAAVWRLDVALAALIFASALRDFAAVDVGPIHLTQFNIVLAATLMMWVWREVRAKGRAGAPLGPLAWAILLLPLAGLWSVPTSAAPMRSLGYAFTLLWLAGFALLYARFADEESFARRLGAVFVVTALALAAVALLQVAIPGIGLGVGKGYWITKTFRTVRPAAFYLDPNFLGAHLATACVIALGLAADPAERSRRAVWYPAALVLAVVMLLTYSRSAIVALAVGLVVLAITLPKGTRRPVGLLLAGLVVAGLVATPLVIERFPGGRLDASSRTRLLMYVSSAEMIRDHPVFGVGLEAYEKVYPAYRDPEALERIVHPHQVPVALVAETGVMGLLAQVALGIAAVVTFVRRSKLGWHGYDAALLAAFAGLVVGAFFQFFLYFPVMWLVVGLMAAGTGPMRAFSVTRPTD